MNRYNYRAIYITLTCLSFLFCTHNPLQAQNKAASFTWNGQIETDIQTAPIFNGDCTFSIWFMEQFPGAYSGPFVANDASSRNLRFSFGQGRSSYSMAPCDIARPKNGGTILYVQIGNQFRSYLAPVLVNPGQWHHMAVVRSGISYQVFFDGARMVEEQGLAEAVPAGFAPDGMLQFGDDNDPRRQFYGLLDEFFIYDQALSTSEISQLARRQNPGVNSNLILAQVNFDNPLPATWNRTQDCKIVSTTWNNANDAAQMLPPGHSTNFYVPFPPGEIWEAFQGMDNINGDADGSCGSHYGYWSFCLDLKRVGDGFSRQSQSEGEAIVSSSNGIVDTVVDQFVTVAGGSANYIKVLSAPEEYISYMHFSKESNVFQEGDPAKRQDFIAKVSDVGAPGAVHLHTSLTTARTKNQSVSRPFAYTNYDYSQDKGRTWKFAKRRRPLQGDWLRATNPLIYATGKLTRLRVNEVDIAYGNGNDRIIAEVIFTLEGEYKRRAYGFKLRKDADETSHQGMLDLLRTAFRQDREVKLTYRKTHEESFKQEVLVVELQ